jgi:tetratricopeptide (TPR) repeat protein
MAEFPAADQSPAELCREQVRGCNIYVGVLGTRYGSPVRHMPNVSYTELEFDTATEAGLDRLMFLLDTDAADVGIPLSALMDEFWAQQEKFRRRVQASGLTTQRFTNPAALGQLVEHSLRELSERRRQRRNRRQDGQVAAAVVVGEIPQEPPGFQSRPDLLAELYAPGPAGQIRRVRALTGMRGVGKTQLAAAYARARVADRYELVAWINAEDPGGVVAGIAEVAAARRLGGGDAQAAGWATRHWLEVGGEGCLLVFDNVTEPEQLWPFIPATGAAEVIITSFQHSAASRGMAVEVDVFTEGESLRFLADRTGQADDAGARALAAELGYLPSALAQAAAVIAAQHLPYGAYLERLHRLPIADLLVAEEVGNYPRGVAAAVLLSLDAARVADDTGACGAMMSLLAVLSPSGVSRPLLHEAGQQGLPGRDGPIPALAAEQVDRVLARLAATSLLIFTVDGSAVTAHRLVMRVIREQLAARTSLKDVCMMAAQLLNGLAGSLQETWHENRAAVRDLVGQIMALYESSAGCPADDDLARGMIRLRQCAVSFLLYLGDSTAQSILIAGPLLADQERVLGTDHPDTAGTRNDLATAYRDAGRTAEAIRLFEQTLAGRERVLGTDHPEYLNTRTGLATAYRDAGRTAEAISLLGQALTGQGRVLGADHPDTLKTSYNLAVSYRDAGRTAEAISLLGQTLAGQERVLGADHPDTLKTRDDLATAHRDAGPMAEANKPQPPDVV